MPYFDTVMYELTGMNLHNYFFGMTVLKKLGYMAVVKRVCNESMLAAQEEIKNTAAYIASGEVNFIWS